VKKKIFSILFALVLVLTFSLVTAAPVAAATLTVDTSVPVSATNFHTIQDAVDAATGGETIVVAAGNWFGATVDKAVEIRGEGGAVIDDGPSHASWKDGFRLVSGSSGATISHFTFQGLELAIYGWGPDDVTVEHNKIYDTTQGITNWDGDNWVIRHNVIEGIAVSHNGGGIGIAVGSRGDDVSGNIIAHNRIVAHISGLFAFSVGGILLCTDERDVPPGIVSNNKIVHNKVKITSDDDSWAITLQLVPPTGQEPIGTLTNNLVGFNNLRGSDICIGYYPDEATLEPVNKISRNLGEDANRGHGEVPANIFNPVN